MKLKKAIETTISYPRRESIKPILLSVSVALVLSACTPPVAGGIPAPTIKPTSTPTPTATTSHEVKHEVEVPENVAGGIPAPIIPPPSIYDEKSSNFKKKLIKE